MSELTCPDCMQLGQQLELARQEIRRLREELDAMACRHGEELDAVESDMRYEVERAADEARQQALSEV